MEYLVLLGRVLLGAFFVQAGVDHLRKVDMMAPYAAAKGVPAARLSVRVTGVQLLAGGFSILLGAWPQWGVLLIALFLIPTSFMMHAFWAVKDPQAAMMDRVQFGKNIALLGGVLMLLAIPRPWVWSVLR